MSGPITLKRREVVEAQSSGDWKQYHKYFEDFFNGDDIVDDESVGVGVVVGLFG